MTSDNLFKIFVFSLFAGMILTLLYMVPKVIERDNRAQEEAKAMGCEYIGSARDLGSIKFLDCNGQIKIIRVQTK